MPELAEVEFVARQLRSAVVGSRIAHITVAWPGCIAHPDPVAFSDQARGQTIIAIDRRAKILLISLSGAKVLTIHRRMAGNLEIHAPDDPLPPYTRLQLTLDDGRSIAYTDPRKFGRLAIYDQSAIPSLLADFGIEPLGPDFTLVRLTAILFARPRAIKPFLLDQTHIAGLGNIYTDEALFRAGIHPLRLAKTLNDQEIERLHEAIIAVLLTGIAHGGTTFGRHRGVYGEAGTNLDHILAYQRTGKPCTRCGTLIERIVVAQRGTHFCPHCQSAPTP